MPQLAKSYRFQKEPAEASNSVKRYMVIHIFSGIDKCEKKKNNIMHYFNIYEFILYKL